MPVYNCGTCGGHWLTASKRNIVLRRQEVLMPPPVREKIAELAQTWNLLGELWCVGCGVAMRKQQMGWARGVALDQCPRCESLWLDRAALE